MQENQEKRSLIQNIKMRIGRYRRVLNVARKPELDEFKTSLKVTSAGVLLLGFIGFIIFLLYFLVVR